MTSSPSHPPTPEPPECAEPSLPAGSWVVAILFWGTMLTAAGLYAVVTLSSKLVVYLHIKNEHYQTQVKLVTLERQVMYLKKVRHALEHDPHFAAEQARVELGAARPGEDQIAVDESLYFTPDPDFDPRVFRESILPWYAPLLEVFATDGKIRRGCLIAAALMSLLAFTLFQESQTSQLAACARTIKHGWLRVTARYRKSQSPPSETPLSR